MSALTITSKTVKDGSGASVTTQLYADPNNSSNVGPVTALIAADGSGLYGLTNPIPHAATGFNATPTTLFEMVTRQTGVTQKALVFPTTIACTLPAVGSGAVANITNSSNVCGGAFAPNPTWDNVLIDLAVVGQNAADTVTIEIGRVKAGTNTVAELLATVVLTASASTLVLAANPFNGAAHGSVTWRFPDATTITANNSLGLVLQSLGGTSGNLAQLQLSCHNVAYYYIVITALSDGGTRTTNVICTITPQA